MSTGSDDWGAWPVLLDLGTTETDRAGYDVHVTLVQMPRGDTRVRFMLRKHGEDIRRLDMSGFHAMRLPALLAKLVPAAPTPDPAAKGEPSC